MLEHKDYLSSLNKARRKRSQKPDPRLWILILAAVLAVGAIIFAVKYMKKPESGKMAVRSGTAGGGSCGPFCQSGSDPGVGLCKYP